MPGKASAICLHVGVPAHEHFLYGKGVRSALVVGSLRSSSSRLTVSFFSRRVRIPSALRGMRTKGAR